MAVGAVGNVITGEMEPSQAGKSSTPQQNPIQKLLAQAPKPGGG